MFNYDGGHLNVEVGIVRSREREVGVVKRRAVVAVSAIAAIIAACYFAYGARNKSVARSQASNELMKDAAYTETVLKAEADSSNITYQELFDLCDKSLSLKTDLLVELRTGLPGIDPSLRDKLIAYVNAESSVIRSKRAYYRKKLEFDEKTRSQVDLRKRVANAEALSDYYQKQRNLEEALRFAEEAAQMLRSNIDLGRNVHESAQDLQAAVNAYWIAYGDALKLETEVAKLCKSARLSVGSPFNQLQKGAEDSVKHIRELTAQFEGPGR
jgi:tetratricopeptide (TPR) repeat protein